MEIVNISSAELKENGVISAVLSNGDDIATDIPIMGALGVSALPSPPTASGSAEGAMIAGAMIGGRDVRTADVYGQMTAGDTCLHSVGPNHPSKVLLKEDGTIGIMTKNGEENDIGMIISASGKGTITITVGDAILQLGDNGITLGYGGSFLSIKKSGITIDGPTIALGGAATAATGAMYTSSVTPPSTKVLINP